MSVTHSGALESHLRKQRLNGKKLLVPYITGGYSGWTDAVRASAAQGADAIEIGIPFSDPVMDGPMIQLASEQALARGANPTSILNELRTIEVDVPLAVMCYYNTVHSAGNERFAHSLKDAGVSAAIVPDLPLEEAYEWCANADDAGIETVMLAAPTAPQERLPRILERCNGFVYAVGLLGVTGERDELAGTATKLAARLKSLTDIPVLIGVGVSNAEQAVQACTVADGVVMGASVMRRLVERDAEAVGEYIGEVRRALDSYVAMK